VDGEGKEGADGGGRMNTPRTNFVALDFDRLDMLVSWKAISYE
jgi:hypothetical protein